MDKKENSFHMNIILNLPVNFNNKCFYQKMDSEWQAKGTCITNLKNFMESNFLSRVEGSMSRVTFFSQFFFWKK